MSHRFNVFDVTFALLTSAPTAASYQAQQLQSEAMYANMSVKPN